MKKILLLALILATAAACNDDHENEFIINNTLSVNASQISNAPSQGEIDAVKLRTYTAAEYELATAQWNSGFKLTFPEDVAAAYLVPISRALGLPASGSVEISDNGTMACTAWVEGYLHNSYEKDFFLDKSSAGGSYNVMYVYVDRRAKVGGTIAVDGGTVKYELMLFRGWNTVSVYRRDDTSGTHTVYSSNLPSGLSWVYREKSMK